MRETHVPLESVWSELLKKDQSSHPNLWKAPNYDVHQIWPSWNPVSSYIQKKQWSRLSLRTIEYATNMNEKYFYTFRINQITFTYGERKKEWPNFYGMFRQNLPNSAVFTAILKWSYHNATQSECAHCLICNVSLANRTIYNSRWVSPKTKVI